MRGLWRRGARAVTEPLFRVDGLHVSLPTRSAEPARTATLVEILQGLSFTIRKERSSHRGRVGLGNPLSAARSCDCSNRPPA